VTEDSFLRELQSEFLQEAQDLVARAEELVLQLEKGNGDKSPVGEIFRVAHNLKGSGKAVGFDVLSEFAHEFENLLGQIRLQERPISRSEISLCLSCTDELKALVRQLNENPKQCELPSQLILKIHQFIDGREEKEGLPQPNLVTAGIKKPEQSLRPAEAAPAVDPGDETIRVALRRIDDLINLFGEQLILQNRLDHLRRLSELPREQIDQVVIQLNRLTLDLQKTALSLRMVSVKNLFAKMERVARDTSARTQKAVQFAVEGTEHEIDKSVISMLTDPLTHMVRNSIDHGIENAEIRAQRGKSEVATVKLKAQRRSGSVEITLRDDGGGLDEERIRNKAIEAGLISPDRQLQTQDVYQLIFANGFSTKDSADEISGRGVGMNVVQEAVRALKGSIEVQSQRGEGTSFTIRIPLSLDLFNGLIIRSGQQLVVVPLADIVEIRRGDKLAIRPFDQRRGVFEFREQSIPVFDLTAELSRQKVYQRRERPVLILQHQQRQAAFSVDSIERQMRVVQKSLGAETKQAAHISGATILGDGALALILDTASLMQDCLSEAWA